MPNGNCCRSCWRLVLPSSHLAKASSFYQNIPTLESLFGFRDTNKHEVGPKFDRRTMWRESLRKSGNSVRFLVDVCNSVWRARVAHFRSKNGVVMRWAGVNTLTKGGLCVAQSPKQFGIAMRGATCIWSVGWEKCFTPDSLSLSLSRIWKCANIYCQVAAAWHCDRALSRRMKVRHSTHTFTSDMW